MITLPRLRLFGLAAAILSLGSSALQSQVLLNLSWNSGTQVFSAAATGASPGANAVGIQFWDGVTLKGFLTAPWGGDTVQYGTATDTTGTTLTDHTGSPLYNDLYVDNMSGSTIDLNLFRNTTSTMDFTTGASAFSGTADFVLTGLINNPYGTSSFSSFLPTVGTTGDLYAGYSGTTGSPVLIGRPPTGSGRYMLARLQRCCFARRIESKARR